MLMSLYNLIQPFWQKFKLQILCVHPVYPCAGGPGQTLLRGSAGLAGEGAGPQGGPGGDREGRDGGGGRHQDHRALLQARGHSAAGAVLLHRAG